MGEVRGCCGKRQRDYQNEYFSSTVHCTKRTLLKLSENPLGHHGFFYPTLAIEMLHTRTRKLHLYRRGK
ncbi:hypothetical protein Nepgr_014125 [Nepenthes gracilis]|uniref:Uncharacterized protein n=1 Tax=Nepenthes gracilis TaxID=150966 RepID=A0AAD3XPU9_NEPGR|nr:hypothetical protein Nepgr_014125 [Nepenthes gracilis]